MHIHEYTYTCMRCMLHSHMYAHINAYTLDYSYIENHKAFKLLHFRGLLQTNMDTTLFTLVRCLRVEYLETSVEEKNPQDGCGCSNKIAESHMSSKQLQLYALLTWKRIAKRINLIGSLGS